MTIKLRAHHLLCLQGFQGYGYSKEFVKNMTKIHKRIKEDPTKIKVTNKPDDLCKSCPNLINNICKDKKENERIINMDQKVIEKIPKKDHYTSRELFKYVNNEFNSLESIKNICFNCKWWDVCIFVKNIENR